MQRIRLVINKLNQSIDQLENEIRSKDTLIDFNKYCFKGKNSGKQENHFLITHKHIENDYRELHNNIYQLTKIIKTMVAEFERLDLNISQHFGNKEKD